MSTTFSRRGPVNTSHRADGCRSAVHQRHCQQHVAVDRDQQTRPDHYHSRYRLMPNLHRPPDTTRQSCLSSCLCRVWCAGVNWTIAVQTSNFLSATVWSCREFNSHRRSGRDTDKTVLSCLVALVAWYTVKNVGAVWVPHGAVWCRWGAIELELALTAEPRCAREATSSSDEVSRDRKRCRALPFITAPRR